MPRGEQQCNAHQDLIDRRMHREPAADIRHRDRRERERPEETPGKISGHRKTDGRDERHNDIERKGGRFHDLRRERKKRHRRQIPGRSRVPYRGIQEGDNKEIYARHCDVMHAITYKLQTLYFELLYLITSKLAEPSVFLSSSSSTMFTSIVTRFNAPWYPMIGWRCIWCRSKSGNPIRISGVPVSCVRNFA